MAYLDTPAVQAIDQILEKQNSKRILLLTGNQSFNNKSLIDYFSNLTKKKDVTHYQGFSSNPDFDELSHVLQDLKGANPNLIIAVGGGTILDYSKLISIYLKNPQCINEDFKKINGSEVIAPILAIPTTAGSGSEATHFAVIYRDGKKYSVTSKHIKPQFVVIDALLTHTMPPYLTACTGMDALCQAMESLWSVNANTTSKEFATKALKKIVPNLIKAVQNPDHTSRKNMCLGAFYAGKAIDITKTTGPHAFSYHLTTHYNIPHGQAVSMTMEAFIKLNYDYIGKDVQEIFQRMFNISTCAELIDKFTNIKKSIGLDINLNDIGLNNSNEWQAYQENVNIERLSNNPAKIDFMQIRKLLTENHN